METLFEKTIDLGEYSVILRNHSLEYVFKCNSGRKIVPVPTWFDISLDTPEDGGKLEIKFKDKCGSVMHFSHFMPSDLKGMFDFIGRGYRVFE